MNSRISKIIVIMCLAAVFSCKEETKKETLTVSTQEILLGDTGLDNTDAAAVFEVTSSANWKLRHYTWLTPSVTSGESGTTRVSVTATATNAERIGYITVVSDDSRDVSVYITIRQVPEELVPSTLTVTPSSIHVDFEGKTSAGTSSTITISANKDWTITDLPDWITATPESGNAGTDIAIALTISSIAGERTGSFMINAGYLSERVSIYQYDNNPEKNIPVTIVFSKEMDIINHGNYLEFITYSPPEQFFAADLSDNVGGSIECSYSFEYQVVDDLSSQFTMVDTDWNWVLNVTGVAIPGNGIGIDPDDETLWNSFSYDLMPAIGVGWGEGKKTRIIFNFNQAGSRILIRNLRVVALRQ